MCPNCGSDHILSFWNDEGDVDGYLCNECGHEWEDEDEDEEEEEE